MTNKNFFPRFAFAIRFALSVALAFTSISSFAQQPESVYGDKVKFDVRMKYVYSLEEATGLAIESGKPIFVNCFADWAVPCHGMNKHVFSNQEFADYMEQNFVCTFLDMSTEAGKAFGKKYDVDSYAQYLILDADGNVLLRILGGEQLPGFQQSVALALNPLTTLPGAKKAYDDGARDKATLLNYLNVLYLMHDISTYRSIDSVYVNMLTEDEYAKRENWKPITMLIRSHKDNKFFQYMTRNKAAFIAESGEETVNRFIESLLTYEVYPYTDGDTPYDAMELLDIYREMKRAQLPDSLEIWAYYNIAKLRGENKMTELYTYLKENRKKLGRLAVDIDRSLLRTAKEEEQKKQLLAYYKEAEAIETYDGNKRQLNKLITELSTNVGINFEYTLTFDEVLAKAKAQGKRVFMDCYTTWCGPCKMMSNDIFPLKEVGDYFNPRYVSIKVDMESAEGRELNKRYKIQAYPTMLILDNEGEEINRIVGACNGKELIDHASEK